MFPHRGEPRQPQKHRGAIVYTDKSPDYDDSITQALIERNILDEARASVALDKGDDQTIAVEGGLSRTSVPSVARDTGKREEPTMVKAKGLPLGRQGTDVIHVIKTYVNIGSKFTAEQVWNSLGNHKRTEWVQGYGGRDAAYKKVKVALNNIAYSGALDLERIAPATFRYIGDYGTPSEAYMRSTQSKKKQKTQQAGVPVDKSVPKPATIPDVTTPEGDLGDYKHIGTSLDGEPLYFDALTNTVGTLTFKELL